MSINRCRNEMETRRFAWAGLAACILLGAIISTAPGQSGAAADSDAPKVSTAIEDEVLENLRGQELGPAMVRDLKLPEPFLRRVADRVIRTTFRERYRMVIVQPSLSATAGRRDSRGGSTGAGAVGSSAIPAAERASDDRSSVGSRLAWGAGGFVVVLAAVYIALLRRGRRA